MFGPACLANQPRRGAAKRPIERGVTLIELVVVMVLLGAMAAMAMPNVMVWIRNTEIRNVATSLQTGLQRARAEAMRRNELVRFTLVDLGSSAVMSDACGDSANGTSWVVSLDDPDGKCGKVISDTVDPRILDRHVTTASSGVRVRGTSAAAVAADEVVFNGFGRVVGAGALTVIDVDNETAGDDYRALRIMLGPGGTMRMCEPKVSSKTDPRVC
jgi:type IV fimbrial biogenesis protein FimT